MNPEAVASGVLLAALLILLIRLSFSLWARGHRIFAVIVGVPAALYSFGLIMAGAGFGQF